MESLATVGWVTPDNLGWVRRLLQIPVDLRQGGASAWSLFQENGMPEPRPVELAALLARELQGAPQLIDAWQLYSYDKRTTTGPYLDGLEVGFYDRQKLDVVQHNDPAAACADFIVRECAAVLASP